MSAESRDRLNRTIDYATIYARSPSGILLDTPSPINPTASRHGLTGVRGIFAVGGGIGGAGRANLGNVGRGHNFRRWTLAVGRVNTPLMSGDRYRRGSNSVLPAGTPLRDVSTLARAFQRRRARLREMDTHGQDTEILQLQDQGLPNSATPLPGALLESGNSTVVFTPYPTGGASRDFPLSLGEIPSILHNVITQAAGGGESEFLPPEKKLCNSIDTAGKEVMKELHQLNSTPAKKKAVREKKVRTLMQMR